MLVKDEIYCFLLLKDLAQHEQLYFTFVLSASMYLSNLYRIEVAFSVKWQKNWLLH